MPDPKKKKKSPPPAPEVLNDFSAALRDYRKEQEEEARPAIGLEILGEPVLWEVVSLKDPNFIQVYVPWAAGESSNAIEVFEALLAPDSLAEWRAAIERNEGRFPLDLTEMRTVIWGTIGKLVEMREAKLESSAD